MFFCNPLSFCYTPWFPWATFKTNGRYYIWPCNDNSFVSNISQVRHSGQYNSILDKCLTWMSLKQKHFFNAGSDKISAIVIGSIFHVWEMLVIGYIAFSHNKRLVIYVVNILNRYVYLYICLFDHLIWSINISTLANQLWN